MSFDWQSCILRVGVTIQIPIEAGTYGHQRWSVTDTHGIHTLPTRKREGPYSLIGDGKRSAELFLQMKDASRTPAIVESFFMGVETGPRWDYGGKE